MQDQISINPPSSSPRAAHGASLATATVISFSLTFVCAGLALLLGLLPQRFADLQLPVDMGVVLLLVPVCALVFALLAEALRAALGGVPRGRERRIRALADGPLRALKERGGA